MTTAAQTADYTLSTWEAAREVGVSDQNIREMIKRGQLRSTRGVDGRYKLDPAQIRRVAEARRLLREALTP